MDGDRSELTTDEENFRAMMRAFGDMISNRLPEDVRFALVVFDGDEVGGYVGSGDRTEAAAALRVTAARLETGEEWQRPGRRRPVLPPPADPL